MPAPPDPAAVDGPDIFSGRYRTQARFGPLGAAGQARLAGGRVLLVGCGATGSALADTLARAGVGLKSAGGWLRLVDRDFVELSNLTRQVLYTEADAAARTPKAIAAAERLGAVNSEVNCDPRVGDVTAANVERLSEDATLILDGTDNFEARFLLNDLSLETGVPWVYCGAVGGGGRAMPVLPHKTACLRCVLPEPPPPGAAETCDTAGVILPAVNVAAAFAATFALKILAGLPGGGAGFISDPHLLHIDAWGGTVRRVGTRALRESGECPACGAGGPAERLWLKGGRGSGSATLCGRGGVQLAAPPGGGRVDLEALAARWRRAAGDGKVRANRFLAAVEVGALEPDRDGGEVTAFADGRVIVTGTTDPVLARRAASAWVGG